MSRLYVLLVTLALATAGCLGGGDDDEDAPDTPDDGTGAGNETRDGGDGGAGNETDPGDGTQDDGGDADDGTGGDNATGEDEPAKPDPSAALLDQEFGGSGEASFTVPVNYSRLRVGVQDDEPTHTPFTVTLSSPDGEEATIEGGGAGLAPSSEPMCYWANVPSGAAGEWSLTMEADNPTETLRVLVYASDSVDSPTGDTQGACSMPAADGEDADEGEG